MQLLGSLVASTGLHLSVCLQMVLIYICHVTWCYRSKGVNLLCSCWVRWWPLPASTYLSASGWWLWQPASPPSPGLALPRDVIYSTTNMMQIHGCGSESGSALIWVAGSGSGSRRAKMTPKYRKSKDFSCFEMLDVLFWGLKASPSPVACASFMEA